MRKPKVDKKTEDVYLKSLNAIEAHSGIREVKDDPTRIIWPMNLKFDESKYLNEVKDYIVSTYDKHYSKGDVQTFELLVSSGKAEGFSLGSIMKYADRYGKKNGHNREDLLKIIHYGILQLYVHDREGRK
jgi:hypothetical protein